MRLLFVTTPAPCAGVVFPLARYAETARDLGHEVAVFGARNVPWLPYASDPEGFHHVLFVIQSADDLPDLPDLPRLLDRVPRRRRAVIDLWGRYNDTITVDHDANHLKEADGHDGAEWCEAFRAVSDLILQPTLVPRRADVRPFLFHGFDPACVRRPWVSVREAVRAWREKRYGLIYVGSNWQRWAQVRRLVEALAPLRERLGGACLAGWDWLERPAWAVEFGVEKGVEVDPPFLARNRVEVRGPVNPDAVTALLSKARFSPVLHGPVARELALVSNRLFETFCADTVPLLALPEEQIEAVLGPAARVLAVGDDPVAHVEDVLARPEAYWEAILKTREHLARCHSFERRLEQLQAILADGDRALAGA